MNANKHRRASRDTIRHAFNNVAENTLDLVFIRRPDICGGEPDVAGTRLTLRTILASLAEGATVREILEDLPTLTEQHVLAIVAFAANSARENLPLSAVPDLP